MRLLTAILLVFALFIAGCLSQQVQTPNETHPSQNETRPDNGSSLIDNDSTVISSGNTSVIAPGGEGNVSISHPAVNISNQTNASNFSNESAPAPSGIPFGDGYLLALDDLSVSGPDSPCGIFSVRYAANSSVISNLMICQGESGYWTSPGNHRYRIWVVKAAAGYTGSSAWADVRIFG